MSSGGVIGDTEKDVGIPFLRRADLVIRRSDTSGHSCWTIKDPVTLAFFQLREEEYFIFNSLTDGATVQSIVSAFEKVFAPTKLSLGRLDQYIRSLSAMGLVVNRFGDRARLIAKNQHDRRKAWIASLSNPLVVRWRGINPTWLIDRVYPLVRWCFTRTFVFASLATVLVSFVWLVVHFEEVSVRLPALSSLVSLHNMVWIAAAIGIAKVLHEFGHALTCKHFGGQCREMGIMLLVFTPCLYCNVSDAWLMNNRWHRIAISGAGIFIELLLAAIASLLWWNSEPGVLNSICMNMMIVCSVNTVLFNGNPLLKYDGYYVLTDLIGIPNLAAQSKNRLVDSIMTLMCGVRVANERLFPSRGRTALAIFGAASVTYRWFVLVLILWTLHQILQPLGLVAVAQLITASCVLTYLIASFRSARIFLRKLSRFSINRVRLAVCCALIGYVMFTIWTLPVSRTVSAPAMVKPAEATYVYVEEKGRIAENQHERPSCGDVVAENDVLVQLESSTLSHQVLQLRERIELLRLRISTIEKMQVNRGQPNENLPALKKLSESLQEQMDRFRSRYEKLTVRAPVAGVVLPDAWRARTVSRYQLGQWEGSPVEKQSTGATLDRGATYCLIGDPNSLSATLLVDESEIESVRVGQAVRLWIREQPSEVIMGRVIGVSAAEAEGGPEALVAKDDIKLIDDGNGTTRLASTSFNVRVSLELISTAIPVRSTGWAKIEISPATIGQRIKRYLLNTFRLSP